MSDIEVITVQDTDWVAFIAKEMNLIEVLIFESVKSIRLVPAIRKNIE